MKELDLDFGTHGSKAAVVDLVMVRDSIIHDGLVATPPQAEAAIQAASAILDLIGQ